MIWLKRIAATLITLALLATPIVIGLRGADLRHERRIANSAQLEAVNARAEAVAAKAQAARAASAARIAAIQDAVYRVCIAQNKGARDLNTLIDYVRAALLAGRPTPGQRLFVRGLPRATVRICTPIPTRR